VPRATWSKCLPVALWPAADRAAWKAAMAPGDLFDPAHTITARWGPHMWRNVKQGYGRWLFFLKKRGWLDETASPAVRPTRKRLVGYLDDLKQTNRGHTIHSRIAALADAMRALAPAEDWGFIKRAAGRLRGETVPARDKHACLVPIAAVILKGCRLMTDAEAAQGFSDLARAALYRDGLLIVFLAYHLLRLRNLTALCLERHVIEQGDGFVLSIKASETKTHQAIEQELPARISAALPRYRDHYRPTLMKARGRCHRPVTDELWVSQHGSPCGDQTIRKIVKRHLRGADGLPLTPHLLRSIGATTVAIEAPGSVDIIPAILGHRSATTSERVYNLAGNLEATRTYAAMRRDMKRTLEQASMPCSGQPKSAPAHS
jgi:integrase/recombinase XerD